MKAALLFRTRLFSFFTVSIIFTALALPYSSFAQQRSAYDLAAWIIAAVPDQDTTSINWALKEGGDIDFMRGGSNALHYAIYYKKPAMVKFLLGKGASPLVVNEDGRNALQHAEKVGNADILLLIKKSMGIAAAPEQVLKMEAVPQKSVPVIIPETPVTEAVKPDLPVKTNSLKVSDIVLHSRDRGKTWERGTIKEISMDPTLITDNQPLYLLENQAKTAQGYFDISYITTLGRQSSWTSFFAGDWDLHLPIAATERIIDRDVYQIISGGDRLPPLRINTNGTYSWIIDKAKVIKGRWKANNNAPGIILIAGYRGANWLMYNTSNAQNHKIYKADYVMMVSEANYTPQHGFRIKNPFPTPLLNKP